MAGVRATLSRVAEHLDESIGRRDDAPAAQLSPVPASRDVGRRPLRNVGRVEIDRVVPDPTQPRVEFDQEAIDRLAQSIRDKGQLAPIHVRWDEALEKWVVICGERRWRATKRAGLPTIDCLFHDDQLTRSQVLEQQLIENLLREDLKPVEQARAFSALMELNKWNGKQVAVALRVPESTISRSLALLRLPEDLQRRVDSGELPARSAYELSKLDDDTLRRTLADDAVAGRLSHDQAARAVRQRKGTRSGSRKLRLTFPTESGWKVIVTSGRRGGYAEVEHALREALEEVQRRIENNVQLY